MPRKRTNQERHSRATARGSGEFLLKVEGRGQNHSLEWNMCTYMHFGCSSGERRCQAALSLLLLGDLFLDEHGLLIASLDPSMSYFHCTNSPVTPSARRHLFPWIPLYCFYYLCIGNYSYSCHLLAEEITSGELPSAQVIYLVSGGTVWFQIKKRQVSRQVSFSTGCSF